MTLEQLRMLVQVADSGSVLAAAEALLRTQPTVSVGIRKLEEEFNLNLLDRESYRAKLTPEGEAFCHKARQLLGHAEELRGLARLLEAGAEPEVRVAVEASCPMPALLGTLGGCERRYPSTRFSLLGETIRGALERLQQGEADLAITPWFEDDMNLESFKLLTTEMVAVAAPGFAPEGMLSLAQVRELAQVVVRDSSRQDTGGSYGLLDEGRCWFVNDHQTKKEIILAGLGWGRLQRHLVQDALDSGDLVRLEIRDFEVVMPLEIRVARRRGREPGPVASRLWGELRVLAGRFGTDV
ncbi:MAG: LysR family transcriptional regulator [Desulfuromonas sp.]|nr:MAG: LysR family transcriptional regulator [Desulfuromonas sp.]